MFFANIYGFWGTFKNPRVNLIKNWDYYQILTA
jgi:hypothetical protein